MAELILPLYFLKSTNAVSSTDNEYVVDSSFVDLNAGVNITIADGDYKNGTFVEFRAAGSSSMTFIGRDGSEGSLSMTAGEVLKLIYIENGWQRIDSPDGGS